jgi:hypothetical protein
MGCMRVWPLASHIGAAAGAYVTVRKSRAARFLVESLATDGTVPMDLWCSAARVACMCVASLQSPAGRGSGGGGPYMPPW